MRFKRLAMAAFLLVATFFVFVPHILSQQQGGSGLSVSPTRTELVIEPGQADVVNVTIRNVSGIPVLAQATINDFEADNQTGEPRIIINETEPSPASIRNFLVGVSDIELGVDESKTFDIPVQIAEGTPPGAYYGVVRYTAIPLDQQLDDGQVALNASVGTLVLIEVPGDITQQIQLQKVSALRDGKASSFFTAGPEQAAVTIKNTGNSFAKPFGRVVVTNMQGKEVFSYELNDTTPRSNVLPDSTRTFTDTIENVNSLGRYTITANISHATGSDVLTLKSSFWVLPWWFLIALAAVLILIIVICVLLYRRITRRKRRGY